MKTLKVKIIRCEFQIHPASPHTVQIKEFESKVNEFLSNLDVEKIYKIDYLNSSASGQNPYSVLIAVINYYEN